MPLTEKTAHVPFAQADGARYGTRRGWVPEGGVHMMTRPRSGIGEPTERSKHTLERAAKVRQGDGLFQVTRDLPDGPYGQILRAVPGQEDDGNWGDHMEWLDEIQAVLVPEHRIEDDGGDEMSAEAREGLGPGGGGMDGVAVRQPGRQYLAHGRVIVHDQDAGGGSMTAELLMEANLRLRWARKADLETRVISPQGCFNHGGKQRTCQGRLGRSVTTTPYRWNDLGRTAGTRTPHVPGLM
jgi:hypothetical protein